ncbi:peptidase [Rhodococcus sp. ARC_M6]|uniref:peptidase n=1 Tax=Rhodococcus sp. ARC_M6 TaxID=2928852 RepID=UPI001FB2935A|nr:peptidase [Rhodococcus sp. ARC_M6]MCJ0901922.1 peptidase [Rhodococcus sp. ARC_M6]
MRPLPIPLRNHGRELRCLLTVLGALTLVAALGWFTNVAAQPPIPLPDGGIGVRLLDASTAGREDPRAAIYIVDHVTPGTTIQRHVEVSNTTSSPALVSLYAAAADIHDGTFVLADGRTPNELSVSTTLDPSAPDIGAGEQVTTTVTISVPSDAAPGEQYGVIWAEVRSDPSATGGVTQVSRVGIRIYLSIGTGNPPRTDFEVESLTPGRTSDGGPELAATVHNRGGRAVDLSGTLTLTGGPGGLSAGPFPITLGTTLAPGGSSSVTIALDDQVPAGPWNAEIAMKSGLIERKANAAITFPDQGTAANVEVTATTPDGRTRWFTAALIALLAAVVVITGRQIRSRKSNPNVTLPSTSTS